MSEELPPGDPDEIEDAPEVPDAENDEVPGDDDLHIPILAGGPD